MGVGYTRQSAADIVDGELIVAAPLNTEFNQLESAFNGTTGHSHDGTVGEGPKLDFAVSITGNTDLLAIEALAGTSGGLFKTAANTWALRTLTAPAAGISVTNGDGVSGNPTIVLANDLAALEGLATSGFAARTGTDTWAIRSLTAPAAGFTITNPAGTAGDPTFVLADDLAALEGMAGTGIVSRTASNTYAQRSLSAPAAGFTITNPAGIAGDPTFVLADDLAALEGMSGTGLVARTAANTYAQRTLTAPAAGISVTNGSGVSGNPTLALANDLAALEGLASTGIAVRSTTDTWVQRTITGTANQVTVTNGNGVSGNPTLSVPSTFILPGTLDVTGATILPVTSDGTALGSGTKMFSDLFLATGGVINWNNGSATIKNSGADIIFSRNVSGLTDVVRLTGVFSTSFEPVTDGLVSLGNSGNSWSSLYIASGGAINFNGSDITVTHSSNTLTFGGATSGYVFNNGLVSLGAGQLQFPASQNASTNTNTLDDYKEATSYTATITPVGGSFTTVSLSNTRICKAGKKTEVHGRIVCTTLGTASGVITLSSGTWPSPDSGLVAVGVCNNATTGTIGIARMETSGNISLYLSGFAIPFTGNGQSLDFTIEYYAAA